jgi:hypothetical protein
MICRTGLRNRNAIRSATESEMTNVAARRVMITAGLDEKDRAKIRLRSGREKKGRPLPIPDQPASRAPAIRISL